MTSIASENRSDAKLHIP